VFDKLGHGSGDSIAGLVLAGVPVIRVPRIYSTDRDTGRMTPIYNTHSGPHRVACIRGMQTGVVEREHV
jgi:hypothetical protein